MVARKGGQERIKVKICGRGRRGRRLLLATLGCRQMSLRSVQTHVFDERIDVGLHRVHICVDITRDVVRVRETRLVFGELRWSWADGVFVVECQRAGAAAAIVEREMGELREVHRQRGGPCARLRWRRDRTIWGTRGEELHEALHLPRGLHQLLKGGLHDLILARGGRAMQFESGDVAGSRGDR